MRKKKTLGTSIDNPISAPNPNSDTRTQIFITIARSGDGGISQSDIGRRLKIPPQNVSYHLPILEESGVVFRHDDNKYYAQSLFYDVEMLDYCVGKILDIQNKIILEKDLVVNNEEGVVVEEMLLNCVVSMIHLIQENALNVKNGD